MKKHLLLITSFLVTINVIISQPLTSIPYDMMIELAEEQFELGEYFNALEWYEKAYKEVRTEDVALTVGYLHYKLKNYERAENWYKRVLPKDEDNIYIDDNYVYGNALKSLGKYEEALSSYEKIITLSSNEELKALSRLAIEGIKKAPLLEPNEDIVIEFAEGSVNSAFQEYGPLQYDEGTLYFSSFQRRKEIVLDGSEKHYHAKIFTASITDEGFDNPKALHRRINRDDFHSGNVTFSKDKRIMYFTRQIIHHNEVLSSSIYASIQGDEDWRAPSPLPAVNGDFVSKHPAVGELFGREVLFFVSNMEGGLGGFDIYYSEINGDEMSAAVNLGESINTAGDDITPFYKDGILYYSTDGLPSMGGFDIHKSDWDGENWSTPVNMGLNYNTSYDDMYFSYSDKDTKGYLVSNRPDEKKKSLKSKTCCDDIYTFDTRKMLIDLLVGVGTLENEKEVPLTGATVSLYNLTIPAKPEAQTQPEEYRFNYDLDGERQYKIITTRNGYFPDTAEFNTFGILDTYTVRKKVMLKKVAPPEPEPEEPEYETITINQEIRLENIYYDFDKWDILPESEEDLSIILQLMFDYPDMVVELSSHTDARGVTKYNEDLSQKRAQSAKDWLTERGVVSERIVPKGYGESQILNRCINGVRCPDDEHRFNRRTQFKVIEGPQTIQINKKVLKQRVKSFFKERETNDPVPKIAFDKSFLDLGDVRAGEKKELIYTFTNTGDAPLLIDLVTACKCTSTDWPKELIPPGGTGKIRAVFDGKGMSGEYYKTIDIFTNIDTEPIVFEAKFRVNVIASKKVE